MKKLLRIAMAWALFTGSAYGQSSPNFVPNQVITSPQWNSVLSGKVDVFGGILNGPTINGGTFNNPNITNLHLTSIDGTPIGPNTPSTGAFTSLSATSLTLGSLNSTPIGAITPSTGAFTTLSATSFSASAMNSTPIGGTTPSTGAFTTLSASGAATLSSDASVAGTLTTKYVNPTRTTTYTTGQTFGPGVALVYGSTTTSGAVGSSAGTAAAYVWNSPSNSVDASAYSGGYYNTWFQQNESGTKGNQGAVNIRMTQTANTLDTNPFFWNPLTVKCDLENAAGTSSSNCIGTSSVTFMGASATGWGLVEGGEFGINRTSGSGALRSSVLNLTYNNTGSVASNEDAMLSFSSSPGNTTGSTDLISIGQSNTQWPISTSGWFWVATQQTNLNPGNAALVPNQAAGAFNFSNVNFTSHVLWAPGFDLNGNESATINSLHVVDGNSGPILSASYYKATSCGVSSAGTGTYVNGEQVYPTGQAGVITLTVGGGVVTGCTWTKAAFSATNPATLATTGGSGNQDFVASVGWTLHSTLGLGNDTITTAVNIGSGTSNVLVGGGTALATNATTGFLIVPTMPGLPTGSIGSANQAPVVVDTTDSKFCWALGGGTWGCTGNGSLSYSGSWAPGDCVQQGSSTNVLVDFTCPVGNVTGSGTNLHGAYWTGANSIDDFIFGPTFSLSGSGTPTLNVTMLDTVHGSSTSSLNLSGQDDYLSSLAGTFTLPALTTLQSGVTVLFPNQGSGHLTVDGSTNSVPINGVFTSGNQATVCQFGFMGGTSDGTHLNSFGFPGFDTITSGALVSFSTASGCLTAGNLSGDISTTGSLVTTVAKVHGVTYPSAPSANTVPVVTSASGGGTVTYESVPNAALANAATTVNGVTCTLGSTCTVSGISGGLKVTRRTIASGSTDTAATTDMAVFWKSASGATKTETVPNCTSGNDGIWLKIVDEQGDAGSHPINVAPASSGTIGGGSSYAINSNYAGVDLVCDGSTTNWVPN